MKGLSQVSGLALNLTGEGSKSQKSIVTGSSPPGRMEITIPNNQTKPNQTKKPKKKKNFINCKIL